MAESYPVKVKHVYKGPPIARFIPQIAPEEHKSMIGIENSFSSHPYNLSKQTSPTIIGDVAYMRSSSRLEAFSLGDFARYGLATSWEEREPLFQSWLDTGQKYGTKYFDYVRLPQKTYSSGAVESFGDSPAKFHPDDTPVRKHVHYFRLDEWPNNEAGKAVSKIENIRQSLTRHGYRAADIDNLGVGYLPENAIYGVTRTESGRIRFAAAEDAHDKIVRDAKFLGVKPEDLLNSIESKRNEVLEKISKIIDNNQVNFEQSLLLPNISVITTLYNASEYIEGYLNSFKEQTYINKELIIVDANSTDNSYELFQKFYSQNHDLNIKYIKCDVKINQMKALNIALENSVGEYIAICLIDDRPANDWLEVLSKHLFFNNDIDLVYGDTLQTNKPNETFTNNSSHGRLYEHSRKEFSKENMIKCLPGPMPMFRVSMVKKHGAHREDLPHAGDWELWNRCVRGGSIFKKISSPVGLYFSNPKGMSTDPEKSLIKLKEEKQVFYEYRDVFGKHNFNTFRLYFDQV